MIYDQLPPQPTEEPPEESEAPEVSEASLLNAALSVWWAQVWRVGLVSMILYGLANYISGNMPNLTETLMTLGSHNGWIFFLSVYVLFISFWATSSTLRDIYAPFSLRIEDKFGGEIRTPGFREHFYVWMTQFLRFAFIWILMDMASVFGLRMSESMGGQEHAYMSLADIVCSKVALALTTVLYLWAVRESLKDRYFAFRIVLSMGKGQ